MRTLVVLCAAVAAMAADAGTLRVVMLSGSKEYDSDHALPKLAAYLREHADADCTILKAVGTTDLPGLEALDRCDVALFFTRRLTLPAEQLERVKKYVLAGRPLVG